MTADHDVQAKLAAVVWNFHILRRSPDELVAALLPVVREYADQRAAEEMQAAAEQLELHGRFDVPVPDLLRARADALSTHSKRST